MKDDTVASAAPTHRVLHRSKRPSKITIPLHAHPAAKIVFTEMRRQNITYDELEHASGVLKSTFKAWRTHNAPSLESIQACLGALGWEFLPVPRLENFPPEARVLLDQAAELWKREDSLVCQFISTVAAAPTADPELKEAA